MSRSIAAPASKVGSGNSRDRLTKEPRGTEQRPAIDGMDVRLMVLLAKPWGE